MIIPALKSASLISLGQLCDDNCHILLTKSHLHTIKNGKTILTGYRNPRDGLWDIPLQAVPSHQALLPNPAVPLSTSTRVPQKHHTMQVIIRKNQPACDLVKYLHAACFSPVKSTWLKAIKNNQFLTWPGLTTTLVNKHLPPTLPTVQGHLHRERKNLQSTKATLSTA